MRSRLWPFAACAWLLTAGCSKRPRPVEPEKPAQPAEGTETGVGDVVDYFTGRTPLSIKKQAQEKLDRITQERERQLQELLGAEEDGARPAGEGEPPPAEGPARPR